jgi:hypothetical protein
MAMAFSTLPRGPVIRPSQSKALGTQRPFCRTHAPLQRRSLIVRAEDTKQKDKKEKLVENFKKGGLDKQTAQRVLDVWKETGASDDQGLKKLFLKRSLTAAAALALQTGLDAGAAYGAFSLSGFLSAADSIPLNWLWSFAATALGSYFGAGVVFDLFSVGALVASSVQFQTDSAAFMAAVKEIAGAGGSTGINVVDKAAQARSTLKVLSALSNISKLLKEEGARGGAGGVPTLSNLSTYLLLQKAEEQYNWDYEKEGLSVDEAGTIARLFSRFDTNSDDRLDLSEIQALARDLQPDLSGDEVKEAFKVLDADNSRFIELPEFAKLYKDQLKKPDEVLTPN